MSSKRNLEDFLADEEFIRWVKGSDPELDEFWTKWISYHPESCEVILLAKEIILSFDKGRDSKDHELIEAKEEVLRHLLTYADASGRKDRQRPEGRKISSYILLKIAAVIIFCFGLSFLAQYLNSPSDDEFSVSKMIVKENTRGRKQTYLPDGSLVWLNSATKITYSDKFNQAQIRKVYLSGEAYFEVKKDPSRPFTVISKNFSTTALGTSFNVNAYSKDDDVIVSLAEGKVRIAEDSSTDTFLLTPGTQLTYSGDTHNIKIQPFNADVELGWIEGVLLFKNAGFDEVIERLKKFYTISVDYTGTAPEWNYTGRFSNASLEQVLERISAVEQFNFSIEEENLKIWMHK